jgi:RND family efflux transporter MFP subunit
LALLKYALPPFIILAAVAASIVIIRSKEKPEEKAFIRAVPSVDWIEVDRGPMFLNVTSQGTVSPRVQTQLIAEITGTVIWVSPTLYEGGFFKQGDVLVSMDPTDYLAAEAQAKSMLAQMQLLLAQEEALATQARTDWERMGGKDPSPLVLRIPQLDKARADVAYAQASLLVAERNLAFTSVKAPYDGRVLEKYVDIGQTVAAKASPIATLFAIDSVEVRLPLSSRDLAFLDLPGPGGSAEDPNMPIPVVLRTEQHPEGWPASFERTEGAIDARTRLLHAIVRVEDPYGLKLDEHANVRPPLKIGQFVFAEIHGRRVDDAIKLPRRALRAGDQVHRITEDSRLEFIPVEVLRNERDHVVVLGELMQGQRLVITQLEAVVEGMKVSAAANPWKPSSTGASSR